MANEVNWNRLVRMQGQPVSPLRAAGRCSNAQAYTEEAMRRLGALAKIERPSRKILREIHQRIDQDRGKIAAVEPRSGRYFLGETLVEAAKEARKSFPGRVFYFVRVGSRTAHRHQVGPRRRKA